MERILKLQESARVRSVTADPSDGPGVRSQESGGIGNKQLSEAIAVPVSTIEKWKSAIKRGEAIESRRYPNFVLEWAIGNDGLWYRRETEQ
jgi:hypothetical protein